MTVKWLDAADHRFYCWDCDEYFDNSEDSQPLTRHPDHNVEELGIARDATPSNESGAEH